MKAAWAHLGRRDRTVAEVRRHLEARVIDAASADGAIAVLIEQGYLDDQRFARAFVTDKRELEHWGAERISRGLLARGVPAPLVEAALAAEPGTPVDADGASHPPELRRALDLLARRHPHPFLDDRDRHRALAMLLRKGYESEVAYDAIRLHAVERRRTVGAASGG